MKMRIMAIDPGGAIGFAVASFETPDEVLTLEHWGEARYHNTFLDGVWNSLNDHKFDCLVVEDFKPRPGLVASWQPDALHQIGALKWMAWKTGTTIAIQKVGDTLSYVTPAKHKPIKRPPLQTQMGFKGAGHGLSALKHAIYFQGHMI